MSVNKEIVEKTKQHLKNLGYEIKTSHIYEVFSQLAGYKNWNTAKAKLVDFTQALDSENEMSGVIKSKSRNVIMVNPPYQYELKELQNLIKDNFFRDNFCYGTTSNGKFYRVDPFTQGGALFLGSAKSGKSEALRFTLAMHMLNNAENTRYFICDTTQYGLGVFSPFADLPAVTQLSGEDDISEMVKALYKEMQSRKQAFEKINKSNLRDYNSTATTKLAQIVVAIEDFDLLMQSRTPGINYRMNQDRPGTVANELKDLIRIGRSYGIVFLATAQRSTNDDYPLNLRSGFGSTLVFHMNRLSDLGNLDIPGAAQVPSHNAGACVSEQGKLKFYKVSAESVKKLLADNRVIFSGSFLTKINL